MAGAFLLRVWMWRRATRRVCDRGGEVDVRAGDLVGSPLRVCKIEPRGDVVDVKAGDLVGRPYVVNLFE